MDLTPENIEKGLLAKRNVSQYQEIKQLRKEVERLSALLQTACNRLGLTTEDELNSPAPFPPPLTEENTHEAAQLAAELTDEQKDILDAEQHYLEQLGAQHFDNIGNYKFWIK